MSFSSEYRLCLRNPTQQKLFCQQDINFLFYIWVAAEQKQCRYICNMSRRSSCNNRRIISTHSTITVNALFRHSCLDTKWHSSKNLMLRIFSVLLDFDRYITALSNNNLEHHNDSCCARVNQVFADICANNGNQVYALGDPGYQNVDWVVPGLEKNQRTTAEQIEFNKVKSNWTR